MITKFLMGVVITLISISTYYVYIGNYSHATYDLLIGYIIYKELVL